MTDQQNELPQSKNRPFLIALIVIVVILFVVRQKEGQNPLQELPKGRNLMCEKKEIYPRAH